VDCVWRLLCQRRQHPQVSCACLLPGREACSDALDSCG
jgi:hypothetical protein